MSDMYLKPCCEFATDSAKERFIATFGYVYYGTPVDARLRVDGMTVDAKSFEAAGLRYIPGSPRVAGRISLA